MDLHNDFTMSSVVGDGVGGDDQTWDDEALCAICRGPYLETEDYGIHTTLGCGCHYHYSCLLHYIRERLGNKTSLEVIDKGKSIGKGIICPKASVNGCFIKPRYLLPQAEFVILYDFGRDNNLPDIITPNDLDKINRWIFKKEEENDEKPNLVEHVLDSDTLIYATTKPCPKCNSRVNHAHGHQCHHINPGYGCLKCRTEFCYKCLEPASRNRTMRGSESACLCRTWTNFCSLFNSIKDIDEYLVMQPYPIDSRCGCALCSDCKPRRPCSLCNGNCAVCLGIVPPGPKSVGEEDMNKFLIDLKLCKESFELRKRVSNRLDEIIDFNTLIRRLRTSCMNARWQSFQEAVNAYAQYQVNNLHRSFDNVMAEIANAVNSSYGDNARRNLLHYAVHSTTDDALQIAQHLVDYYNVSVVAHDIYNNSPLFYFVDACISWTRSHRTMDLPERMLPLLRSMFFKAGFNQIFGQCYRTIATSTFSGLTFKEWLFSCPSVMKIVVELFPELCYQENFHFYGLINAISREQFNCAEILLNAWEEYAIRQNIPFLRKRAALVDKNKQGLTPLCCAAETLIKSKGQRLNGINYTYYSIELQILEFMKLLEFATSVDYTKSIDSTFSCTNQCDEDDSSTMENRKMRLNLLKEALPIICGTTLRKAFYRYDILFKALHDIDQNWLQDLIYDQSITVESLTDDRSNPLPQSTTILHLACYNCNSIIVQDILRALLKDPRSGYERCIRDLMEDDDDDDDRNKASRNDDACIRNFWLRSRDNKGNLPIHNIFKAFKQSIDMAMFPTDLFLSIFYASGRKNILELQINGIPLMIYCTKINTHLAHKLLNPLNTNLVHNKHLTFDPRLLAVFTAEMIWQLVFAMNDFLYTSRLVNSLVKRCEAIKAKKILHSVKDANNDDDDDLEDAEAMIKTVISCCWEQYETMDIVSFLQRLFQRNNYTHQAGKFDFVESNIIRWLLREPMFLSVDAFSVVGGDTTHLCLEKTKHRGRVILTWLLESFTPNIVDIIFDVRDNDQRLMRSLILSPLLDGSDGLSILSYEMLPTELIALQFFREIAIYCNPTELNKLCCQTSGTHQSIIFHCCMKQWSDMLVFMINHVDYSHCINWLAVNEYNCGNTFLHMVFTKFSSSSSIVQLCLNSNQLNLCDNFKQVLKSLWKSRNDNGDTPFHVLARYHTGLIPSALKLYQDEVDISHRNVHGDTPLNLVCQANTNLITILAAINAITALGNKPNSDGNSDGSWEVLYQKNNFGVLPILQLIAGFGIDLLPNNLTANLIQKISYHVTEQPYQDINNIVAKNEQLPFDINTYCSNDGQNLLHLIARSGNVHLMRELLITFRTSIRFDIQQWCPPTLNHKDSGSKNQRMNAFHMISSCRSQQNRKWLFDAITTLIKDGTLCPRRSGMWNAWLQKDANGHIPYATSKSVEIFRSEVLNKKNLSMFSLSFIGEENRNLLHCLISSNTECATALGEFLLHPSNANPNELPIALNQTDIHGDIPLMIAIKQSNIDMIRAILSTISTRLDEVVTIKVSNAKSTEKSTIRDILLDFLKDAKVLKKLVNHHSQ